MLELFAAAAAALALQSAADIEGACKAFQAENGGTTDCACFGKLIAEDPDLMAELMTITSPEDLEGASDEMKMTIEACDQKG